MKRAPDDDPNEWLPDWAARRVIVCVAALAWVVTGLAGCGALRIWTGRPDAESLPYADDEDIRRHRPLPDNREFRDDYEEGEQ